MAMLTHITNKASQPICSQPLPAKNFMYVTNPAAAIITEGMILIHHLFAVRHSSCCKRNAGSAGKYITMFAYILENHNGTFISTMLKMVSIKNIFIIKEIIKRISNILLLSFFILSPLRQQINIFRLKKFFAY